MPDILVLADDLSGAADCALAFARAGRRTQVLLHASAAARADADVIALDTDTRHLQAAEASARTVAALRALPARRLYKKIDSTLRGAWAADVAALQPLAGLAIVAPAFPAQGRVVRNGRVEVHGQPLEQTDTWRLEGGTRSPVPAEQLREAGLRTAVLDAESLCNDPQSLAAQIADHAARGVQAVVVDAQSEHALAALAIAAGAWTMDFFWVGSAGLARELAAPGPALRAATEPLRPPAGAIVAVVGSLSDVSARQCAALCRDGSIHERVVAPEVLRGGPQHARWASLQDEIGQLLARQESILLRMGRDTELRMEEAAHLCAALATLVRPQAHRVGAWVLTGGETARAILSACGVARLQLLEEIEPGIALAQAAGETALRPLVVTKAGAFGSEQALLRAWQRLQALRESNQP